MRPHQECLLLASGSDGRQADDRQVAQLRDFVRAMLARKSPSGGAVRDIDLFDRQDGLAASVGRPERRALLPVEPAQEMIAFDLAALLHAPHWRKFAVLPPLALARDMARVASAADPMPILAALQDALRHARAVTVFRDAQARDLALLGAGNIAALPLPALPPSRPDAMDRTVVWLFDHEPARGRSAALAASVSEALPDAEVVVADGGMAPLRSLHLHLGAEPVGGSAAAWRVVDSFAARCPVVHLVDGPARAEPAERLEMAVTAMRTGILAANADEAVAGLVRLARDAALVDVFRAQAGQAAEAFNRRIEDRMRELSP